MYLAQGMWIKEGKKKCNHRYLDQPQLNLEILTMPRHISYFYHHYNYSDKHRNLKTEVVF